MSYARFGAEGSDVYVFLAVDRHLECCGCSLGEKSYRVGSTDEMLAHLREHADAGHNVPASCVIELEDDREENDAFIAGGEL